VAYPSTQVQRRFVTKCRRGGGVQPGLLDGRRSDARGLTTCRAALVTDNPGLPRAPPGAQTGTVHRQSILLLSTTLRTGRSGLVNAGEARACTVDAL
jgi:hypothetical protein